MQLVGDACWQSIYTADITDVGPTRLFTED